MKTIVAFSLIISLLGCRKSADNTYTSSAGITITNAVIGGNTIVLNGSANDNNSVVFPNSFQQFPLLTGQIQLLLNDPTTEPVITYYDQPLAVTEKGKYSLFLTGTSPLDVEAVLITEDFQNYTDSICGVRFINLSPGSAPMSINIQGAATGNEVSGLSYKSHSDFKAYPAKLDDLLTGINFEVRNAATGDLIITFSLIPNTFQNVTLAIVGEQTSPQIIQVNNF